MKYSKKLIYNIMIHLSLYLFLFVGCASVQQKVIIVQPKTIKKVEPIVPKIEDKEPIEIIEEKETKEIISVLEPEPVVISNELAIIFPSATIGKYALEAVNTINAYLLYKDTPFTLTVLDMITQNKKNILNIFEKIKEKDIHKVIAMITKDNLSILNEIENIENIEIYLPLINKNEIEDIEQLLNLNIVFGAIDYQAQFDKLIKYADSSSLVELYDNSAIGNTLHNYVKSNNIKYIKKVDDNNGRYKSFLKNNKRLNGSVIILNTPIVKSSILLSAITVEDLNVDRIISTQLNYTPLLFSLTQKQDRKKLIVANSIGKLPLDLEEYNQLIGNNILYSWVNYSAIVGIEYLLSGNIDFFTDLILEKNQIIYPVKLYNVGDYSFELIK